MYVQCLESPQSVLLCLTFDALLNTPTSSMSSTSKPISQVSDQSQKLTSSDSPPTHSDNAHTSLENDKDTSDVVSAGTSLHGPFDLFWMGIAGGRPQYPTRKEKCIIEDEEDVIRKDDVVKAELNLRAAEGASSTSTNTQCGSGASEPKSTEVIP